MHLFRIPASQASAALRALKTVAMANGVFDDQERSLLDVAARLYGADEVDLDALRPISPLDLAQTIISYEDRRRLLQACMVMALADGEATAEEWRLLDELRTDLGVGDARMEIFKNVATRRRDLAHADARRRAAARGRDAQGDAHGLGRVLRYFGAAVGSTADDVALAWRYKKLGLLPAGTLGRALWEHCTARELSFPGEPHGPPEAVIRHDLIHVLAGYPTDAKGRLLAAAFTAGMKHEEAFAFVFFPMLELAKGDFDADAFAKALERGDACKVDLTDDTWDFWAAFPLAMDALRAEYGIGEG